MASSASDVQVVPEPGVEVDQRAVVEAVPERGAEVEQPVAVEACDGGSGSPATTTVKGQSLMLTTEQHDYTGPGPDHHEDAAAAPEQQAAEESASEKPDEQEKPPPVAKEEEPEHTKAPEAEDDHQAESTRERLKRHRQEVAGRVWVPEKWGQEKLLKDWVDCAVFDRPLVPAGLLKARRALVAESCTRRRPDRTSTTTTVSSAGSSPLRVQNGCS